MSKLYIPPSASLKPGRLNKTAAEHTSRPRLLSAQSGGLFAHQ